MGDGRWAMGDRRWRWIMGDGDSDGGDSGNTHTHTEREGERDVHLSQHEHDCRWDQRRPEQVGYPHKHQGGASFARVDGRGHGAAHLDGGGAERVLTSCTGGGVLLGGGGQRELCALETEQSRAERETNTGPRPTSTYRENSVAIGRLDESLMPRPLTSTPT